MDDKIYTYAGKILRVDLSTGATSTEPTLKYAKRWLGGRGVGQWILYNELKPWVTPYEPANILVVGAGPFVGTLFPAATRLSIASKNPFNNGVGTANSGGHFAPELKFAGYDHIVFQGKAKYPVYLCINDDYVELKDARSIWGKTTWETDDLIKKELGDDDIQIMCIGPAGENLVRAACIVNNRNRAAGRCGLGAVMGSKNLKAVAVKGTGSIEVANPDRFMESVEKAREKLAGAASTQRYSKNGTFAILPAVTEKSVIQYKNFQEGQIPQTNANKIYPDVFMTNYQKRGMGCMACPISCSNYFEVSHGPYAGLGTEGFEFNCIGNFAGKLAIDDPAAIIKAHSLCNQLGLDMDNATGVIAWAFECYQRGILDQNNTGGLKLDWGDYGVAFELLRKMAYREDFGNLLADGSKHASETLGRQSDYFAIHMKGQELYEEVRFPLGWGLGVCVATRGGGHTTSAANDASMGNPSLAEVARQVYGVENVNPAEYEGKAKMVLYTERLQELVNSLGICMFTGVWSDPTLVSFPELAGLYSAATGWETTEQELIKAADRILNVEKAFNVLHAGFSRKDDYPPERLLREPIKTGSRKGFALSKEKFDRMLDEYYQLHGWDLETGWPIRKCLEDLDLQQVANDLEKVDRLPG